MITDFTPVSALLGGTLIGLAAVLLMAFHGRIAGMTGIVGGLVSPVAGDWGWRAAFLAGAIAAPGAMVAFAGYDAGFASETPLALIIVSGLLVGIGVTFGGGCTSGHGVCGIARLSPRSIAATFTFMITAIITVFITRHLLGGM